MGQEKAKAWRISGPVLKLSKYKNNYLNMCVVGRFILHIAILAKTLVALFTLKWGLLLVWPRLTHSHQALLAKAGGAWNVAAAART